jgi:hypothetical protein
MKKFMIAALVVVSVLFGGVACKTGQDLVIPPGTGQDR